MLVTPVTASPELQLGDKGLLAHQLLMLTIQKTELQKRLFPFAEHHPEAIFAPGSPPPGAL